MYKREKFSKRDLRILKKIGNEYSHLIRKHMGAEVKPLPVECIDVLYAEYMNAVPNDQIHAVLYSNERPGTAIYIEIYNETIKAFSVDEFIQCEMLMKISQFVGEVFSKFGYSYGFDGYKGIVDNPLSLVKDHHPNMPVVMIHTHMVVNEVSGYFNVIVPMNVMRSGFTLPPITNWEYDLQ